MGDLTLAIVIFVLALTSFIMGFALCLWGVHMKIREISETSHYHNGMKWIKLMEWIKS